MGRAVEQANLEALLGQRVEGVLAQMALQQECHQTLPPVPAGDLALPVGLKGGAENP